MARELSGLTSNGAPGKRRCPLTTLNQLRAWNMLPWVSEPFHARFQVSVNFFKEKKSLVPRVETETFRFSDEYDYEYEIFSVLSSVRAWASVILAGKRGSRRHSTASFRTNVVVS